MSIFKRSQSKKEEISTPPPISYPGVFKNVRSDILKKPSGSEKALRLQELNQYVFIVKPNVNKKMVKEEIERRYGVKVRAINIVRQELKGLKKAVITLKAGQKIEI